MILSITNTIHKVLSKRFEVLLTAPEMAHVKFYKDDVSRGFNMIEYSVEWSKFAKIADARIKEEKLDEKLGVFTRKHSDAFINKLTPILESISVTDMVQATNRFKTWCD